MRLIEQFRDRAERILVFRSDVGGRCESGFVQLRARFDAGRGRFVFVAAETVGGKGPDDDRELVAEAWAIARELLKHDRAAAA